MCWNFTVYFLRNQRTAVLLVPSDKLINLKLKDEHGPYGPDDIIDLLGLCLPWSLELEIIPVFILRQDSPDL